MWRPEGGEGNNTKPAEKWHVDRERWHNIITNHFYRPF